MKLAISNIAWTPERDKDVYELMRQIGFSGLEIAPTRIFNEEPYDKLYEAETWSKTLRETYGFVIPSMQSIWFGKNERLFGSSEERKILSEYTKKAIHFANVTGCHNLVFGCAANRCIEQESHPETAVAFFKELGDYAYEHGTVIGMEANPLIYHTNYINTTDSALKLIDSVHSKGFLLNLDIGTMIQNDEEIHMLKGQVQYINHIHISEPYLKRIRIRALHNQLYELLCQENYEGFISVEMSKGSSLAELDETMKYVYGTFTGNNSREENHL